MLLNTPFRLVTTIGPITAAQTPQSRHTGMTSIWWGHEGHLGPVMRVPGCGDLVISQEQVIGGERCEDCSGATRSHLSSEANVTFMEHFNGRTMFRNFVSHLVNFYKDQGLIHQRFSRNAPNISSGFNTNFDVSVSQCSGQCRQWSHGERHNMTRP